jgi:Transposase IS116/IS110/IS902 family
MEVPSAADHGGTAGAGEPSTTASGGDRRRVDTTPHQLSGGIDWHARTMVLGLCSQAGESLLHRQRKAAPEPFLQALAPDRGALVVGVECRLTWDWLADRCASEGSSVVWGHALSMQAIHGGQAQTAHLDAQQMAGLRRGGMLPQTYVSPAPRRATRDLLRRRRRLVRKRAAWLAPSQPTTRQEHLPESGKQLADQANRAGVTERVPAPAGRRRLALDLTRIDPAERLRTAVELALVNPATAHDAQTCYRLRLIPGVGKRLALGLLDESPAITRCPRGQACVSSGRLVQGATKSAGTRDGPSGQTRGKASLTWAFSEAAVVVLRQNPAGQKDLARVERRQGTGQALTVLAPTRARAVYDRLTRDTAFEGGQCLPGAWSGVDEPRAERDAEGRSLARRCSSSGKAASESASEPRGL